MFSQNRNQPIWTDLRVCFPHAGCLVEFKLSIVTVPLYKTETERHPKEIYRLGFTAMWDMFSYYGMKALLIAYIVTQLRLGGESTHYEPLSTVYIDPVSPVYNDPSSPCVNDPLKVFNFK
jgi:hypothetical protein